MAARSRVFFPFLTAKYYYQRCDNSAGDVSDALRAKDVLSRGFNVPT